MTWILPPDWSGMAGLDSGITSAKDPKTLRSGSFYGAEKRPLEPEGIRPSIRSAPLVKTSEFVSGNVTSVLEYT